MSPIRAVLFDFDGVIAHTAPNVLGAVWSFFGMKNISLSPAEFHRIGFMTRSLEQSIAHIKEVHGYDIDFEEMCNHLNAEQAISIQEGIETDPSLLYFLKYCAEHTIAVAVGSNSLSARIVYILETLGMLQYFYCNKENNMDGYTIIGVENLVNHKPDPEVWLRAAETVSTELSECLVIEDGLPGILGAKACGAIPLYYHRFSPINTQLLEASQAGISDFFQAIDFIEMQKSCNL